MIGWLLAAMLATAAPSAGSAQAAAPPPHDPSLWLHAASGATFPRRFNNVSISDTRDLGSAWDSVLVYDGGGGAVESVTVYVFRAAFPDARLWFQRALPAVARDIPLDIFEVGQETTFSAFGSAAPNGLYRIYHTTRPGPFRTTALAIAQAGPWLVKIRYSSASLDADAMAARLTALGGAIRFPDTVATAALSPQLFDCTGSPVDGTGRPSDLNEENLAAATVGVLRHFPRFRQPLADTAQWCRDAGFPAERGTLLRLVEDPQNWALLAGDSGKAVVAISGTQMGLPEEGRRSVVLTVTPEFVRVATMFEGTPPMMQALQAAAPILSGRSQGLLEIGPDPQPVQR